MFDAREKPETGRYYNNGWFGRHPEAYEFMSRFITPLRRRAARSAGPAPRKIIDIATGTGSHAAQLARLGHDVVGVDLDRKMLDKAEKKRCRDLMLRFFYGDGTDLPFPDSSFDAATISFAIHDVPGRIAVRILREARRVTRAGGNILIVDYNDLYASFGARFLYRFARLYESPNYFPFVRRGIAPLLDSAGLTIKDKTSFLGAVQFLSVG